MEDTNKKFLSQLELSRPPGEETFSDKQLNLKAMRFPKWTAPNRTDRDCQNCLKRPAKRHARDKPHSQPKAPSPSLSAWKECLMLVCTLKRPAELIDQHASGTHGKKVVGPAPVSWSSQGGELPQQGCGDRFLAVVENDTKVDCGRRRRRTTAAPCSSFSGVFGALTKQTSQELLNA